MARTDLRVPTVNKGTFIHPRMFDLHSRLWDQQVEIEEAVETFDAVQQPVRAYGPAFDPAEPLDCRVGVMSAADARSIESRYPEMTLSTDTRYIAIKGYYPQITKGMRANVVDGDVWNIVGAIDDTTHTQTYLVVEQVKP